MLYVCVAVQVILAKRQSHTCCCLLFSRASLVGREEYMVDDSPSFLGSTGLFGRAGKPEERKRAGWLAEQALQWLFRLKPEKLLDNYVYINIYALVKDQLQPPGFPLLVTELPLKVTEAWGVLVPPDVRELDDSLRTRQVQLNLVGTRMGGFTSTNK